MALETTIRTAHLGFAGVEETQRAIDNDRRSWWHKLKETFSYEQLIDVDNILNLFEAGLKMLAEKIEVRLGSRSCEVLLDTVGSSA